LVQQPGLVDFRERGRDAAPRRVEEAGDGSQVGTERAELVAPRRLPVSARYGRRKPSGTPPVASPPGSRGRRLGTAAGGLPASAVACPACCPGDVRIAARARPARRPGAARGVAGRSTRGSEGGRRGRIWDLRFWIWIWNFRFLRRDQAALGETGEAEVPFRIAEPDERFGQARDHRRAAQRWPGNPPMRAGRTGRGVARWRVAAYPLGNHRAFCPRTSQPTSRRISPWERTISRRRL